MKNVMRKVCSLFLIGVVAVSMFGFIAPTRAEAIETEYGGELCLYWDDGANYCKNYGDIAINVSFCDSRGKCLKTFDVKGVTADHNGWVFEFPKGTKDIFVEVFNKNSNVCIGKCCKSVIDDKLYSTYKFIVKSVESYTGETKVMVLYFPF